MLPYANVCASNDPDAMLMEFLETSYTAVAELANWDRAALEIPFGAYGKPYDVAHHRAD